MSGKDDYEKFRQFTEEGALPRTQPISVTEQDQCDAVLKTLAALADRLLKLEENVAALPRQHRQMQITIEQLQRKLTDLDEPIREVLASLGALGRRLEHR